MVIAAWAALLASCGPAPGTECDTAGYRCASTSSALECRDGKWRSLPCRGALGCTVTDGQVDCDVSRNRIDDACGEAHEGFSICDPTGTAVLECRVGTFLQTHACSSCSPSGATVTCVP
jgi:hypothetical protein